MSDPSELASAPVLLQRGEPKFCLRCNSLLSIDDRRCPQCGLGFNPDNPATYTSGTRFVRWKFWFPGLLLAIASGAITYAVVFLSGEMGFALFVSVPVSFAAILGYATSVRFWGLMFLSIFAIGGVVFLIVSMNFAGLFCGLTLAAIFLVPVLFGTMLGWGLKAILKNSAWDQRQYLPVILLAAMPFGVAAVEKMLPHPIVIASVATDMTFRAAPARAWNSIMFYEQVEHEPPLLLTLALPRPIRAGGSMAAVGDVQRCIYQKGELVKQISRRIEGELLEFRVTEQHLHFEHDVTLVDGSFRLEPIDAANTRVTLNTRYIRHLSPAWLWEPMERKIVHTLHGHVLEGMRRRAESVNEQGPEPVYPPVREAPFLVQTGPAPE